MTLCFLLSATVFLAHFLFLPQFGLYEDDLIFVLPSLQWSWHDYRFSTQNLINHFVQGRPLYFLFQYAFAYGGWRIGGLELIHLISFFLVCLEAIIAFCLLRRLFGAGPGFLGALVLVLFPLDTSRQFAMHQGALLLPMCILLGAIHLFVAGRLIPAYLLATTLLFLYESYYLPFLVAPLLAASIRPVSWRDFLRHLGLWTLTLALVFGGRSLLHDPRAQETVGSFSVVLPRALTAPFIGFWSGVYHWVVRPADAWRHGSCLEYLIMVAVLVGVARALYTAPERSPETGASRPRWLAVAAGLLAWLLPYLVAFRADYYPPITSLGRLTGIHAPAAFGAALLASVWWQKLVETAPSWSRLPLCAGAGVLIAGAAGFGVQIQLREYVEQWAKQRLFWTWVIDQLRDVRDGDAILLELNASETDALPMTRGFREGALINETYLLPYLIKWPADLWHKPRLTAYWPGSHFHDTPDGGRVIENPQWQPDLWPEVKDNRLIYLRARNGRLERVSGPVRVCGKEFIARDNASGTLGPLTKTHIFRKIFEPPPDEPWVSLRNAKSYPTH